MKGCFIDNMYLFNQCPTDASYQLLHKQELKLDLLWTQTVMPRPQREMPHSGVCNCDYPGAMATRPAVATALTDN